MIIPTLYRIVDTWLGGMRLERFVEMQRPRIVKATGPISEATAAALKKAWHDHYTGGGMRLERFVGRIGERRPNWETVGASDRPVGGFYILSFEDYQRLTSRVDKAEKRAAAQRKSRLERAGKGEA